MIPLSDFVSDADALSANAFCAKYDAPFLVYWTSQELSGKQLRDTRGATLDRLVLKKKPNTIGGRSLIENYHVGLLRTERPSKQVWVGYSNICDVVVNDSSVSRVHAYLSRAADGWHVTDASSSAGTLVNDEPPSAEPLSSGDRITLGGIDLLFLEPLQVYRLIHQLELF